jgi:glycosyltransferase involved in cell wall biosynthesis
MAAGRTVIANVPMHGDVQKIIEEAECGYYIEPKNQKKLAEAILKLYSNPHLIEKFGKNGAEYARKNFAIEICCSKYEELFKMLTKKDS